MIIADMIMQIISGIAFIHNIHVYKIKHFQYAPLTQMVEYQTFNLGVTGSSPVWRT